MPNDDGLFQVVDLETFRRRSQANRRPPRKRQPSAGKLLSVPPLFGAGSEMQPPHPDPAPFRMEAPAQSSLQTENEALALRPASATATPPHQLRSGSGQIEAPRKLQAHAPETEPVEEKELSRGPKLAASPPEPPRPPLPSLLATRNWVEALLATSARWKPLLDLLGENWGGALPGEELERLLKRLREDLGASGHSLSDLRPTWTLISQTCENEAYGAAGLALALLWNALAQRLDAPEPNARSVGRACLDLSWSISESFFSDAALSGQFAREFRSTLGTLDEVTWRSLGMQAWVSLQEGVLETLDARGWPSLGASLFLLFAAAFAALIQGEDDGPDALAVTLDLLTDLLEAQRAPAPETSFPAAGARARREQNPAPPLVEASPASAQPEKARLWWRGETSLALARELLAGMETAGLRGAGVHLRDIFGYGPLHLYLACPRAELERALGMLSRVSASQALVSGGERRKPTVFVGSDLPLAVRALDQGGVVWWGSPTCSPWLSGVLEELASPDPAPENSWILLPTQETQVGACRELAARCKARGGQARVLVAANPAGALLAAQSETETQSRSLLGRIKCVELSGPGYRKQLRHLRIGELHVASLLFPPTSDRELIGEVFEALGRLCPTAGLEVIPAPSLKKPILALL